VTSSAAGRTDRLFRIALLVKAVDGAAELVGALVLLTVPGAALTSLVNDIVARDLLGPPDGSLARHFEAGTTGFASGSRTFAVVYLALHGVLKLALVGALLRRWRPAYPVAALVLGVFVGYELYRATRTGSLLLPFLAALDLAIIWLIVQEYRRMPASRPDR
jgi:uncharacterized membrane protein